MLLVSDGSNIDIVSKHRDTEALVFAELKMRVR